VVDLVKQGRVNLIINTPSSRSPRKDEVAIRSNAVAHGIPLITTVSGASAAVNAIQTLLRHEPRVRALQDYFPPGGPTAS
jgi:carbamoyl-phosphate synthase large subunit